MQLSLCISRSKTSVGESFFSKSCNRTRNKVFCAFFFQGFISCKVCAESLEFKMKNSLSNVGFVCLRGKIRLNPTPWPPLTFPPWEGIDKQMGKLGVWEGG